MEERYKLAILRLPENAYYSWIKYLPEAYRREHVTLNTDRRQPSGFAQHSLIPHSSNRINNLKQKEAAEARRNNYGPLST